MKRKLGTASVIALLITVSMLTGLIITPVRAQAVDTFLGQSSTPVINAGAEINNLEVRLEGVNVEVEDTDTSTLLLNEPIANLNSLVINGGEGDDTLTIDFSGGNPVPPGGLSYDAGENTGDYDSLEVVGYNVPQVISSYTGVESGTIQVGSGAPLITYANTEPISISGTAIDLTFSLGSGVPNIDVLLADDSIFGNGMSQISGSFETIIFANPLVSLTIELGNQGDTITMITLDSNFMASLQINGGTGNDTFHFLTAPMFPSSVTVNGGEPGTPLGDKLIYGSAGTVIVTGLGSGVITQAMFTDVEFTGIEQIDTLGPGDIDYGDTPDPKYPTILASDGARHQISPNYFLGNVVDGDLDGQPDANALGDDNDGSDDEDGVVFTTSLIPGKTANVSVEASAASLLDAWVDFNIDGDWGDAGEQIFASQPLAAGSNTLSFTIPLGASAGITFSRFRVSSTGGLSFDDSATDGEVEDYEILISELASISGMKFEDINGNGAQEPGEAEISGWTIQLKDEGGILIAETLTDGSGEYYFDLLAPATYQVHEALPLGWTQTVPGGTGYYEIALSSGQNVLDVDFGNQYIGEPPVTEVGGEVYPVDRLAILIPGLTLAAILIVGAAVVMRRRRARC